MEKIDSAGINVRLGAHIHTYGNQRGLTGFSSDVQLQRSRTFVKITLTIHCNYPQISVFYQNNAKETRMLIIVNQRLQ